MDEFEETSYFNTMDRQRFIGPPAYVICPGAAQQEIIFIYQRYHENIQDGSYNNVWGLKTQTTPYSNHPQVSIPHTKHHESAAWSTVANCYDNGDSHHPGGGVVATGLPNTEKYGNSFGHGNPFSHEHNNYRNGLEYHHIPNRMNHGYRKQFWRCNEHKKV
ncbi:hypothetical protein Ccrd_002274 [Cynara cardunculus var. scolymus]|uniref:Uncharacterized protein n=1 Tax=Cynara cardunculus var. scolymus TaxID=59895 RepID=A0A103XRQ1_CYNCS|nr:hypothetical protein Ccrd_002274 [Cynara cardunculus var. scolymus]